MKILDNTDKEFCQCSGLEYRLDSPWGRTFCILDRHKRCYARAEDIAGKKYHSKEAFLESGRRCPKCDGRIYTIIKHPIKRRERSLINAH